MTGTILPFERDRKQLPYGAVGMPLMPGISEKDLPPTDLLRAVREAVRVDRRQRGLRQLILNVSFGNPMLSPPETVHWSTVEVVVRKDPATGQLAADPIDLPPGWGRRAVQLFQARVGDLVRNRPDSKFVKALITNQVPEPVQPTGLRALMVTLERLADGLGSTVFSQLELKHLELTAVASRIVDQVEEAGRSRCSVQPVAAGAGVDWVLNDLIEDAQTQLVLSLPQITYNALNTLLPSLELAAKRGVTLVLLWGDHQSAKLDGKVAIALFDLQARFPDQILLEQRSSRTAASMVVCDDRRAFVGSQSVLGGVQGSGVLVEPVAGTDEPPNCVSDLLSWARKAYPYWDPAQRIALHPMEFGRPQQAAEYTWDQRVQLPDLPDDWTDDDVAARTIWSASWGRVLRELVAAVDGVYSGDPVVTTVWDGMYLDLVQRSMTAETERLVVTDDRAEAEVCSERLAKVLLGHRDRGATVHLQHPPIPSSQQYSKSYAELLKALGADRTVRFTKAKARTVIADHEVVVGSHRPLGNRPFNPARGPAPQELGLHIMSTSFAAQFARELGIPDWFSADADGVALPAYLPPLPSLSGASVEDDPWTVLAARQREGAPPERLRREAAALLLASDDGDPRRREWGRWLLNDAWQRHAFIEAYLLSGYLDERDLMPGDLAAVAVPLEHGPLGEQFFYSVSELEDATADHRVVALVGAIAETLIQGSDMGKAALEVIIDPQGKLAVGLPEGWLRLARAAAVCFDSVKAPLPLHEIDDWAARRERTADLALRWSKLTSDIRDFEMAEQHFNFVDGQKMHRALFRPGRLFADILEMAQDSTPAQRRQEVVATLPKDVRQARVYIDHLSADFELTTVEWGKHHHYAQRVSDLVTTERGGRCRGAAAR
jgi:hypothetical protein